MAFTPQPFPEHENPHLKLLEASIRPIPGWIIGSSTNDDNDDPYGLYFRHGESTSNKVDNDFTGLFKQGLLQNTGNGKPQSLYHLILEYFLKKLEIGHNTEVGLVTGGIDKSKRVNTGLVKALSKTNRKINCITVSPYPRCIHTAKNTLDGIVAIDMEKLIKEGGHMSGGIDIRTDRRVRERDNQCKIGFIPFVIWQFLKQHEHENGFRAWMEDNTQELEQEFPTLSEQTEEVLEILEHIKGGTYESDENLVMRMREHRDDFLGNIPKNGIGITFTHAGALKMLVAGIVSDTLNGNQNLSGVTDPEIINAIKGIKPGNLSMTIIGKSPDGIIYLAGFNLEPTGNDTGDSSAE